MIWMFRTLIVSSMTVAACLSLAADETGIRTWPAPDGEALSEDYELRVNGQAVPVYACRVSAVPFNQVWPGYQRPLDQTELAGFACWEMQGPVKIEVQSRRAVQSVVVRPASRGIRPIVENDRITFSLDRPGPLMVEVNGIASPLHLFASPPEQDAPAPDAPGVRYFGPGIHRPGKIELKSGESVYLAGGAVVYGSVHARGASNIRIAGRGILDLGPFSAARAAARFDCRTVPDVTIEGIVMRDPDVWCCSLFGCRDVTDRRRETGRPVALQRRRDRCLQQPGRGGSRLLRPRLRRRPGDQGPQVRADSFDDRPVRNVRFRRCVVWCDWGRAMEIGAETSRRRSPTWFSKTATSCGPRTSPWISSTATGPRSTTSGSRTFAWRSTTGTRAADADAAGGAVPAAPDDRYCPTLLEIVIRQNNYSKDDHRGMIRDVVFKRHRSDRPARSPSSFRGFDAEHDVAGVTIADLRFNGKPAGNAQEARLQIGPHVGRVQFSKTAP